MTKQVGGDDVIVLGKLGNDVVPRARTPRKTVNQENRLTRARPPIADGVTVDRHVLKWQAFAHTPSIARSASRPTSAHPINLAIERAEPCGEPGREGVAPKLTGAMWYRVAVSEAADRSRSS